MSSSSSEYCIDSAETVCGTLDFGEKHGFHDSGSCHEEGAVADTTGGGNHLATGSEYGVAGDFG